MQLAKPLATVSVGENASPLPLLSSGASEIIYRFVTNLAATAAASALFVLLAMAAGGGVAMLFRADRRERFTISVEFATRNCAIAAAVAITLLGDTRFAVFATTYFFTEAALVGLAIAAFRRRAAPRP